MNLIKNTASIHQAHCHYVVLKAFHESVQSAGLSPSNHAVMETLCSLHAVFGIVEYAGEFAAVSTCGVGLCECEGRGHSWRSITTGNQLLSSLQTHNSTCYLPR